MSVTLQTTSYTLTEFYDSVRGDVGLRATNLVTDADILRWGKEAMRAAAQETHYYRKTATIDSVINQAEYSLPTDAINLEYVAYNQLPLELITYDELMIGEYYWRQTGSGTPLMYYRRGVTSYGLYPKPDATTVNVIELTYTALPAMPTTGSDHFNFPTANERLLLAYACWRASIKDATGEGGKRVDLYQREYMAEMLRFKQMVSDLGEGEATVMGGYSTLAAVDPITLLVARATIPAPV